MKRLAKTLTRILGAEIKRYRPDFSSGITSLSARESQRGRVLIAYILEPFLRKTSEVSTRHTHHWESVLMANVWRDLGFAVDVIDYRNDEFQPRKRYDFLVSARTRLELLASRLNADCIKIAHLDTSHYAFNNQASYERLRAAQDRRGVSVWESMRLMETNRAIECADFGVVLGNETTAETYRYAGRPLFPLDVAAAIEMPFAVGKDHDRVRNRYLWFGSGGMVHKGLDLALEAFSAMPDMHLTVCGPVAREKAFTNAYTKELHDTPNIRLRGWVDVASADFQRIADDCIGIVYPSCAEGQAGAVVTCLRAGLIPIVSRQSGIDIDGFGTTLASCSVEEIQRTVRQVSSMATDELARRAKLAWERATTRHGHEAYSASYRRIVETIVAEAAKPATGRRP